MNKGFWGGAVVATTITILAGSATVQADADKKMSQLDRVFVRKVAQGNIAEVMTSQLALKKSQNERVRQIANMLIKDHSTAQNDLKQVARLHQISLPKTTDPAHKAMYRRLTSLSGPSFDKAFMKGQVKDHNATVALFKKQMEDGTDTHVRSYAAKYLSGIENHTIMIHNVASNLGIPVAGKSMAGNMGHSSSAIKR